MDDGKHGEPREAEREALDRLFSVSYEELRRIAGSVKRGYARLTINPTALVAEVYMKLRKSPAYTSASPDHLKAVVANAMRQVLVDGARRVHARKRGRDAVKVSLDEFIGDPATPAGPLSAEDLLALDAALHRLGELDADGRKVQVVELRYFGGFSWEEIASALNVSEATVHRDWRTARAWLQQALRTA